MSLSLPYSGTVTVEVTRYAVTTQDKSRKPCRSVTISGSAVATIVWSSAASRVASMIALKATISSRRLTPSIYEGWGPRRRHEKGPGRWPDPRGEQCENGATRQRPAALAEQPGQRRPVAVAQ